jgi:hypothetical protein
MVSSTYASPSFSAGFGAARLLTDSIFSLKNEPEGGSEAIRRRASFRGFDF